MGNAAYQREWTNRPENKDRVRRQNRDKRRRLRQQALDALGGRCVRCGFDDPRALQVDHVNDDGHADRQALGASWFGKIMRAIRDGERDKYQLLCANCNWIKRAEADARREY